MHAIRRQAHRAASSANANGTVNYNPFARVRSKDAPLDVESGHQNHDPLVSNEPPVQHTTAPDASEEKEFTTNANENGQASKESADLSDNTAVGEPGLTKRAKFKSHFRRDGNNDAENAHLDRADTDDLTLEERKKRALKKKIPVGQQFRAVLLDSWINVLLVFVPVGFAVFYSHKVNAVGVFCVNFIAIIPLAAILSYATEELAIRVGETFGGLLNATFGNAVELIVSIQALLKHEVTIVKTSLIGSMLSNLLLVLGMSFFLGGVTRMEQYFNVTVAQTAASLLALCIASLIIPTIFHNMIADDNSQGAAQDAIKNSELSHGTAIILLFVYACYLVFQLKSHVSMYNEPSQKVAKRKSSKVQEGATSKGIAAIGASTAAAAGGHANTKGQIFKDADSSEDDDDEVEEPSLSVIGALVTLAVSTTLVAFCSEFMVESINGLTATGKISTTFVGLILLPIVGNAAEHATAVTVAAKDKMDLAIGVAVGSSMQIALLVLPLIVVLGWILGEQCMTLFFDTFLISTLFVSVLLVNYLIQDGKSHWLEGVLLMSSYMIIALAAWFYPNTSEEQCT